MADDLAALLKLSLNDFPTYTSLRVYVGELREAARSQLPGSHQVVVDREWLAIYFDPGSSVSAKFLAGERLRAALSPEPDIKETP